MLFDTFSSSPTSFNCFNMYALTYEIDTALAVQVGQRERFFDNYYLECFAQKVGSSGDVYIDYNDQSTQYWWNGDWHDLHPYHECQQDVFEIDALVAPDGVCPLELIECPHYLPDEYDDFEFEMTGEYMVPVGNPTKKNEEYIKPLLRRESKKGRMKENDHRKTFTLNQNSVPQELKDKYLREGHILSVPDSVNKLFEDLPETVPRDHKHVLRWMIEHQNLHNRGKAYTTVDMLQYHYTAITKANEQQLPVYREMDKMPRFKDVFSVPIKGDMHEMYLSLDKQQKGSVDYYPETRPSNKPTLRIKATVEKLCCYWINNMRFTDSPLEAYYKMLDWLVIFENGKMKPKPGMEFLSPIGLFVFYASIQKLGIKSGKVAAIRKAYNLRKDPLSTGAMNADWEKLVRTSMPFMEFRQEVYWKIPEVRQYCYEMMLHNHFVDNLMTAMGFVAEPSHDSTKLDRKAVLAFAYEWYVRPKVGIETAADECPNCEDPFCKNRGGDSCTSTKSITEALGQHLNSAAKWMKEKTLKVLPAEISALAGKMVEQLQELKGFVAAVLGKVKTVVGACSRLVGLDITSDDVLDRSIDLIKYYVMYINTSSTAVKCLLMYSICSSLGIVDRIMEWFAGDVPTVPEECDPSVKETSFSEGVYAMLERYMDWISSISPTTVAVPLSLIIFILCGVKLAGPQLTSLGKGFVEAMRNMHFVGAGILGISRVFSTMVTAFKYCAEWIGKTFFNRVPEDEAKAQEMKDLVDEYSLWQSTILLLHGDATLEHIMRFKSTSEQVDKLFDAGLKYQHMYNRDELPPPLRHSFTQTFNKLLKIHNQSMRARSVEQCRPVPFHIQLFGKPGVGKSYVIEQLTSWIGREFFPGMQDIKYASNPACAHADGYKGQPIFVVDDMFAVDDAEHVLPLYQMISNVPMRMPMAALEEKGRMFTSPIMVSTTNVPWPEIKGVLDLTALWRRRTILVEFVMDERVKDKATGAFSMKLFKEFYPGVDSTTFPHLKFHFYKPQHPRVFLDADTPPGMSEPYTDLSYASFLDRVKSTFAQHREAEKFFDRSDQAELTAAIRRTLVELDSLKKLCKNPTPIYDFNFADLEGFLPTGKLVDELEVEDPGECSKQMDPEEVGLKAFEDTEVYDQITKALTNKVLTLQEFFNILSLFSLIPANEDKALRNFLYKLYRLKVVVGDETIETYDPSLTDNVENYEELGRSGITGLKYYYLVLCKTWDFKPSKLFDTEKFDTAVKKLGVAPTETSNVNDMPVGGEIAFIGEIEIQVMKLLALIHKCKTKDSALYMTLPWTIDTDPTVVLKFKSAYKGVASEHLDQLYELLSYLVQLRVELSRRDACRRRGVPEASTPEPVASDHWFGDDQDFSDDSCKSRVYAHMKYKVLQHSNMGTFVELFVDEGYRGYVWSKIRFTPEELASIFGDENPVDLQISSWFIRNITYGGVDKDGDHRWMYYMGEDRPIFVHIPGSPISLDMHAALSTKAWFRKSLHEFFSLTDEQKFALLSIVTQKLSSTSWYEMGREILHKAGNIASEAWNILSGGLKIVWSKLATWKTTISVLVVSGAIIGLATLFSRLFVPKETSAPSGKYFGRPHVAVGKVTANNVVPRRVKAATCTIIFEGRVGTGVKICAKQILVPWHQMRNMKESGTFTYENGRHYMSVILTPANVRHIPGTDSCIVHHEEFPQWASIIKHFMTSDDFTQELNDMCVILTRLRGEDVIHHHHYRGMHTKLPYLTNTGLKMTVDYMATFGAPMKEGDSGSPVLNTTIGPTTGRCILGLQSSTTRTYSYVSCVSQETLQFHTDEVSLQYTILPSPLQVVDEVPRETCGILEPHMTLTGTIVKECRAPVGEVSSYQKTILYDVFPVKRIPALLSSRHRWACGDPIRHSLNKHGRGTMTPLPLAELDTAIEFRAELYRWQCGQLRVLSMREAIIGNDMMEHINLKTSPGMPWVLLKDGKPGKHNFIRISEDGELEYLDPRLEAAVYHLEALLKQGDVPPSIMMEVMKDELRPIGKALGLTDEEVEIYYFGNVDPKEWPPDRQCKTRSITVLDICYTIVYRMYFADMMNRLQQHADGENEYCVGINVESPSAFNAFARASSLGPYGFDLDVSNWDGHFTPQLAFAVTDLVNAVYNAPLEDCILRRTLMEFVMFGHVMYRDMCYQKNSGLPSGFPGTADFNTLGHILVTDVFWQLIWMESNWPNKLEYAMLCSKRHLTLWLVYGDDSLVVPHESIAEVINGESLAQKYIQFGWPVTSSEKTGKVEFTKLLDLTFLKRKWMCSPLDPAWVRWALDPGTIHDLCTYVRKTNEPRTQFRQNLMQSLDYSADHGRDFFERTRNLINGGLQLHRSPPVIVTYSEMSAMKRERYFGRVPEVKEQGNLSRFGGDNLGMICAA